MPIAGGTSIMMEETLIPIHDNSCDDDDNIRTVSLPLLLLEQEEVKSNTPIIESSSSSIIISSNSKNDDTSPAATTTTATVVDTIHPSLSDGQQQQQQQQQLLHEEFYPIKSCFSSKSLFHDGENDDISADNNNNTTTTTTTNMKKSVSFHTIQIREHARTISDHPSVSCGIGLGIDWYSIDSLQCSIDEWELYRPPRRTKSNLIIPSLVRTHIVQQECHISQNEINHSLKEIEQIKISRNQAARDPIHSNTIVTTPTIRRRRSFMGLSRLLRPSSKQHTNHNSPWLNHDSTLVDIEVEALMERSIRASQIREQQRQVYLEALQKQQEQQQQPQQDNASESSLLNHRPITTHPSETTVDETTFPVQNDDTVEGTRSDTSPIATGTINHSNSNHNSLFLSSPSPFGTVNHEQQQQPMHERNNTTTPDETEEEAWEF